MKHAFLLFMAILLLTGCKEIKFGPEMEEPAEIFDLCYVPKGHGSDMAFGVTSKGNVSITPIDIDIPERYAVVFQCQHGRFVIDGDRARDIYHHFARGEKVLVHYCEKIEVEGDSRRVVGLHFIGCTKL